MSSAPQRDLRTIPRLDVARYMGDWRVIAHVPYFLEKGKVGTIDRYALRSDGRIDNTFVFHKERLDAPAQEWRGVGWVEDKESQAVWRVRFVWPFSTGYRVLEIDPDYRWAVVSTPGGDLVWILSRSPQMDEALYRDLVDRVRRRGLPADKLAKVQQPSA